MLRDPCFGFLFQVLMFFWFLILNMPFFFILFGFISFFWLFLEAGWLLLFCDHDQFHTRKGIPIIGSGQSLDVSSGDKFPLIGPFTL